MKASELRKLIREEVKKALSEDFSDNIVKDIQAERTAQQRKFIAWAKAAAAKQNIKRLSFQGDAMVTVSMSKLQKKGILTKELVDKWKAAAEGTAENDLYQGLSALLTRYNVLV